MKHHLALAFFLGVSAIWAHPMGNFSVSHYSRIEVTPRGATLRYVLDFAEIPTSQLLQQWKLDAGSPRAELDRRAADQAREWMRNLKIEAGGQSVTPRFERAALTMGNGAGGMTVLRIAADFTLDAAPGSLRYEDRNYPDRSGWKEIVVAAGSDTALDRAEPATPDRSKELTAYPEDSLASPPQDLRAEVTWRATGVLSAAPATPTVTPQVPKENAGVVVHDDYLSRLLSRSDLTWGMILTGLAVAFGLGAIHALSPGHGKTIVAAYLVGSKGTAKHAIFLGGMVTFTHTISVFFLGLTTLFLSEYVVPQKIYPVLGTISGLSIVWIGATLFYKRLRAARRGRVHHSNPLVHDHGDGHVHSHLPEGDVTLGSLIALGASGGLVPCPSALVLLLASVSVGRVGFGLILLVAFSAGLAGVLMAIGLVVLFAKHLLPDSRHTAHNPFFRYVPVASAAVITCAGLIMTAAALGVIQALPGA